MNKTQERLLIMIFSFLATIILMRKENLGIFANLPGIGVFLLVVIITMIITSLDEKPPQTKKPRRTIHHGMAGSTRKPADQNPGRTGDSASSRTDIIKAAGNKHAVHH